MVVMRFLVQNIYGFKVCYFLFKIKLTNYLLLNWENQYF